MGSRFSLILGFSVLFYAVYVIGHSIQIAFGWTEDSWSDLYGHYIALAVIFGLMLFGIVFGNKEEETTAAKKEGESQIKAEEEFNPVTDTLMPGYYQQEVTSWWFDSDGDKHIADTHFARLRFYEDGTLIGVRAQDIPKLTDSASYGLKGTWSQEGAKIHVHLDLTGSRQDKINVEISEEERESMKYAGFIADDSSIIDAGDHLGTIKDDELRLGNHLFKREKTENLIITSDEQSCNAIEQAFSSHPLILASYGNTGNYYTDGDTGPEWFTVTLETLSPFCKQVESALDEYMKESKYASNNLYWS